MMFCVAILLFVHVVCSERTVLSKTPVGNIKGVVKRIKYNGKGYEVVTYLGIPYAEPPIGDLRFSKPVKKKRFEGTFMANKTGFACIQLGAEATVPTSEDCLNLNVIVPGPSVEGKAVIVFIHGGWWQYGMQDLYLSPAFSARNDVILVTLNYRLNVFGFLAHEAYGLHGNYGLWDQKMAIQWVHDNIESLGGDPQRVIIMGNSAGSASVVLQALHPGNEGLFSGIVAESGSPVAPWAHNEDYKETFVDFIKRSGCQLGRVYETVKCLKDLSTDEVNFDPTLLASKLHLPVYDGEFVTFSPNDFSLDYEENPEFFDRLSSYHLITGMTSSDGSWNHKQWSSIVEKRGGNISSGITQDDFRALIKAFERIVGLEFSERENAAIFHQYIDWSDPDDLASNRQAFLDMVKDVEFTASTAAVVSAHARGKGRGKTFMYVFDHKPSFSDLPFYVKGANHEDEIPFVLSFPPNLMKSRHVDVGDDPTADVTSQEYGLSESLQHYWASFAKSSNRNGGIFEDEMGEIQTKWPPFSTDEGHYLLFRADGVTTKTFYRGSAVHFWNVLMPKIRGVENVGESVVKCGEPATCTKPVVSLMLLLSLFIATDNV